MAVLIAVSLLRSNGQTASLIGIERCDLNDWGLLFLLHWTCAVFTLIAICMVKLDHNRKVTYGYLFTKGDIVATPYNMFKMIIMGFLGAFSVAFCGSGPGAIFTPLFIMLGVNELVAAMTGIMLAMYSTLAATSQSLVYGQIDLQYALYINILSVLGTMPGLFSQTYIIEKYKRTSIMMAVGAVLLLMALGITTYVSLPQILELVEEGS